MGHNLNIEGGRASMMYVANVPWHGLGTKLEKPPENAEEALKAANLDWEVGLKKVYCMENGVHYEIAKKRAIVRLDKWGQEDGQPFGLVHSDYRVLQNREAFAFFDGLVQTGKVAFETAGALGRGERVWVLVKVEGEIVVKGDDRVEKYLLLSTGHDGSTAVQIRFTPVRVVCQNTLVLSLASGADLFRIYHTAALKKSLADAQAEIRSIFDEYARLEKVYDRMARVSLSPQGLDAYLSAVYPDPKKKGQSEASYLRALAKVEAVRKAAAEAFEDGAGNDQPGIRGSLWAAYNGVVELVDHRSCYANPGARMTAICFGEGQRVKEAAFKAAKDILATAT